MTATAAATVRPATAEDLPGILDLYAHRFAAAIDEDVWRWKYERLPGPSRSVVALDEQGAILAHAGALGLDARTSSAQGILWQLVDFMGTTLRGGLRSAMVEAGRSLLTEIPRAGDLPWVFGFPGERHFRLGERVFGYRPVRRIPVLEGEIPRGDGAELESGDSCADWAQAAWEACASSGVRRSTAFLNWRYHARPDRYYRFYRLCSSHSGVDGLLVFAFDGVLAKAAEVWLPPGETWVRALATVGGDLRRMGMERWRFWPPSTAETAETLAELGVGPSGESLFLGCQGRAPVDPVAEAAAMHYSMGDYDCT